MKNTNETAIHGQAKDNAHNSMGVDEVDTPKLEKLKNIDVRQAWAHEALEFTPWLAQLENLELLSEALGIDLEDPQQEVSVGPLRADIVARTKTGNLVVIENQLETANIQHLGQILAYIAGLEAQIVVWVATGFMETHLSAIRWLNEHTAEPFAFFAVRVRIVQIGDSDLAPVFDVLERPNEWERRIREAMHYSELSEAGKFRHDFWKYLAEQKSDAPRLQPGYAGSVVWHRIEEVDIRIVQYLAYDRVGLYVIGKRGESTEDLSSRVAHHEKALRDALEAGDDYSAEGKDCVHWITLRIDSYNPTNWKQMADWLDDRRRRYEKVFRENLVSNHSPETTGPKLTDSPTPR